MSGWGTGWPKGQFGKLNTEPKEYPKDMNWVLEQNDKNSVWDGPIDKSAHIGIDLAKPGSDETIYGVYTAEGFKPLSKEEFENKFKNTAPTHDPYTNPNSHIYYECSCGAILDPGTKSFASLNNHASEAGWKIRFGQEGYTPYCVKCGEGVE